MRTRFHAGWLLALCSTVCAQKPPVVPPKAPATPQSLPPKLNKLAAKILEKWETLRYHLEGAGVKSLTFDIAVTSKGGMTGTWKATGKYIFDADPKKPYGTVTWDDEEIARAMKRRGWTAEAFAKDIRKNTPVMSLANATVSAEAARRGTILTVKGGKTKEEQFLLFDSAGVQVGEMVGPMRKRIHYELFKSKYLRIGETYRMPDTEAELKLSHDTVQGVLVPTGLSEVVKVRKRLLSDLTMVFSKHLINTKSSKPGGDNKDVKKDEKGKKGTAGK